MSNDFASLRSSSFATSQAVPKPELGNERCVVGYGPMVFAAAVVAMFAVAVHAAEPADKDLVDAVLKGLRDNYSQVKAFDATIRVEVDEPGRSAAAKWSTRVVCGQDRFRYDIQEGDGNLTSWVLADGCWWRNFPRTKRYEIIPPHNVEDRPPADPRDYGAPDFKTTLAKFLSDPGPSKVYKTDRAGGSTISMEFEQDAAGMMRQMDFDSRYNFLPVSAIARFLPLSAIELRNKVPINTIAISYQTLPSGGFFLKDAVFTYQTSEDDGKWKQRVRHRVEKLALNEDVDLALLEPPPIPEGATVEDQKSGRIYTKGIND